jgi:hypothetical protein
MNSCRMILRIFLTLIVMLSFMSSLAYAAKVDPKPATMKSVGGVVTPPSSLKAAGPTTPIDKDANDLYDIAAKSAARFHKPGGPLKQGLSGFLTEGFETSVPPSGWSQIITNSSYTWSQSSDYVHTGTYSANVPWDYSQDEWLITPALNFTGSSAANLKVSFWFNMSYYWSVTPYNNYNIEVWISTDGGATFPTQLWNSDTYGLFSNFTWYEATVGLSAYATETNVKLAWRFVGDDDADGSIDDIYINDDGAAIGRCCYDAGASCADNTQAECTALGGNWDGTKTCSEPCPLPGVGDDCSNPIVVYLPIQLPYTDAGQTTCGRGADYVGMTCLGSYDGGEDIVYKLDVASTTNVKFTFDPKGTTWTGFAINTSCPPAGTCLLKSTSSSGSARTAVALLAPGTYYLIVSTWPTPDCIADFDLTMETISAVANDNCASATAIGDVTNLAFSTLAATFDGPGGDIVGPNIWYRYTATCDGVGTASLCGSGYDTKVRVWDGGTCPPTVVVGYNDDACGLQSSATFACVAGNQYLIEVGGYTTAAGDGFLSTSCALPPPNDNCVDVTPATLALGTPLVFTGNNAGATNDCSIFAPDAEVWHAFTTTECMTVTVDYCGTSPVFGNIYIALVNGCPCGSYILASSYNFTTCPDGNGTMIYKNLPAGTYYIPVLNDPAYDANGPYTINVNGAECLPPPPNDECADVTPVVLTKGVPVTFTGTTLGATVGSDCSGFSDYANVWEAFTIDFYANVTLDYCGTSPAFEDAWLNLALGCPCTEFTPGATYSFCGDGNVTMTWSGLAPGTYYYPVMNDPDYYSDGPYTIHVVANVLTDFCAAGATTCDEFISNVTVGSINNTTDCGLVGGYSNYTALSTNLVQGASLPISVENGYPYTSDQCGIWVDWNNDFVFEEVVVTGTPGEGPYTGTITAPCDATPGAKRMRIRITYTGTVSPCGTASYGEVEDYTINVLPNLTVTCPGNSSPLVCALDPITIDGFGATAANGNLTSVTVNGIPLDPNPGSFTFTPVEGANNLTLVATDACGATASCVTIVTVTLNQPPVATCPGNSAMLVCNLDQICIPGFGASDPNGNLTSVTVNGLPLTEGQVCFTPVVGANVLTLTATDACGLVATCATTVTVTLNQPPVADAGSDLSVFQCVPTQVCIPASCADPNENLTTCQLVSAVGTYNGTNICFTPTVGGNYAFILKATDACGLTDYDTSVVTVTFDQAPVFTVCPGSPTEIPVVWGTTLNGDVDAIDPDALPDPLEYTLISFDGPITGGLFEVDNVTGAYSWPTVFGDLAYTGEFNVSIEVSDGCKADTCNFNVFMTHHAHQNVEVAKLHDVIQGHYAYVPVNINTAGTLIGGFDLLIGYDASALTLSEILPGAQITAPTLWEYFTYRFGATGNCNGPCPSGLVRIVAIADINNGFPHPVDAAYLLNGTVAVLKFLVTNDRTYECQFVPLGFYWIDCTDNVLSSKNGQQAYIADQIWYYTGDDYPLEEVIRLDNLADGTVWGGYAGWKHTLDPNCLVAEQGKPMPLAIIDFYDGGIDIVCADSIDLRGDINLNGIANEIADAVIFTQYFLVGVTAFPEYNANSRQGAIAATDVNADGTPLSVGDLVYLVRVISGDALPYAKLSPFAQDVNVHYNGNVVATESNVNIGAALLTFKVGEDFKVTNLTNMTLDQKVTAGELKVLLYDISTKSIGSGLRELVSIEGQAQLVAVEVADYNGNMLTSKLDQAMLPTTFALGQNYPNPFNPETVIELALPTTGEVSLNIYNVAGQLVKTLVNGTTPAGYYQIRWDGRDAEGISVSSGVYFYKITTKDFSETRKMLLVK